MEEMDVDTMDVIEGSVDMEMPSQAMSQQHSQSPRKKKSFTSLSPLQQNQKRKLVDMASLQTPAALRKPRTVPEKRISFDAKPEPAAVVPRKIAKPKRSKSSVSDLNSLSVSGIKPSNFYVLDTNILLSHLMDVKALVIRLSKVYAKVKIIIPAIVVQELDGLKKNKQKHKEITNIIKFINEQFKAESLVSGEYDYVREANGGSSSRVAGKPVEVDIEVMNNDDRLLKTCLQIHKVQCQHGSQVHLVTNDVNLSNKALNMSVSVCNWKVLKKQLDDKYSLSDNQEEESDRSSKRRKTTSVAAQSKLSSTPSMPKTSASISVPKLIVISSPTRAHSILSTPANSEGIHRVTLDVVHRRVEPLVCASSWLEFKYECETELRKVIETQLRKDYGELWDKMYRINLENFTLRDAVHVLRQGWMSTFSEFFKRNRAVKELLDVLFNLLKSNTQESHAEKLRQALSKLMGFLKIATKS